MVRYTRNTLIPQRGKCSKYNKKAHVEIVV